MEWAYETPEAAEPVNHGLQIVKYSPFQTYSRSYLRWFDVRVFYIRFCNFEVDDSTTEFLTLNHIPLSPDTLLEVNGLRSGLYSDGISSLLRRDRIDKRTEEVTFVSTDSTRLTGTVKFEVFNKKELILTGSLEVCDVTGYVGDLKNRSGQWKLNCESEMTANNGFLKGKHNAGSELPSPTIEVYVAGCCSGTPIILTKTPQLSFRKKHNKKCMLDAIPEYETSECEKDVSPGLDLQAAEHKRENEEDYKRYCTRTDYLEGDDGELSWFNAGVRVGVGIGLGICLGIGIGVGLLVRSYQVTTRNFRRRLP